MLHRARFRAIVLLIAALFASGCPAGRGEGWVVGNMWIENCRDGAELSGDFDLKADFYVGDPLFDSNDSVPQSSAKLLIRIQESSNDVSEANSLLIQFQDMLQAAQSFVRKKPMPFTDDGLFPEATDINTALRMSMQLLVSCPANQAAMSGLPFDLVEGPTKSPTAREQTCLMPGDVAAAPSACPVLSDSDQQELDAICEAEDFNDRGPRARIEAILGRGAAPSCMYVCQLGPLSRDTPFEDITSYEIDYGDTISALFSSRVVDARAFRLNRCARAQGQLTGMFRFTLVRSRVAQPFP
jgi:hypothetical protein